MPSRASSVAHRTPLPPLLPHHCHFFSLLSAFRQPAGDDEAVVAVRRGGGGCHAPMRRGGGGSFARSGLCASSAGIVAVVPKSHTMHAPVTALVEYVLAPPPPTNPAPRA